MVRQTRHPRCCSVTYATWSRNVLRYSTCRYSILVNTEETGGEFITVGGFVRPGTPGQRLSDQTTWYTAVAQILSYINCAVLEVAVWAEFVIWPYVSMSRGSWGISTSIIASYAKSCWCADHIQPDGVTLAFSLTMMPVLLVQDFILARTLHLPCILMTFKRSASPWTPAGSATVCSLLTIACVQPLPRLSSILQAQNRIFCQKPFQLKLLNFLIISFQKLHC